MTAAKSEHGFIGDWITYLGSDVTLPHFSMQKRLRPLDPRSDAKPS